MRARGGVQNTLAETVSGASMESHLRERTCCHNALAQAWRPSLSPSRAPVWQDSDARGWRRACPEESNCSPLPYVGIDLPTCPRTRRRPPTTAPPAAAAVSTFPPFLSPPALPAPSPPSPHPGLAEGSSRLCLSSGMCAQRRLGSRRGHRWGHGCGRGVSAGAGAGAGAAVGAATGAAAGGVPSESMCV